MTILTKEKGTAGFIVSEANGYRSRDVVTVVATDAVEAGTVMGQITANGNFVPHNAGATDGSENAAGVLYAGIDAAGTTEQTMIVRDAELNENDMTFQTGISVANKTAALNALKALGIVTRKDA